MTGSDPVSGLQWPLDTDPVASLASTVQAMVDGLVAPYSPPLTLPALAGGNGWSGLTRPGGSGEFRVLGNVFQYLDFMLTRVGATITASAIGNITDTLLATLFDTADRPTIPQYLTLMRGSTSGPWGVQIEATGAIQLITGPPGAAIAAGDTVRFQGLYLKK